MKCTEACHILRVPADADYAAIIKAYTDLRAGLAALQARASAAELASQYGADIACLDTAFEVLRRQQERAMNLPLRVDMPAREEASSTHTMPAVLAQASALALSEHQTMPAGKTRSRFRLWLLAGTGLGTAAAIAVGFHLHVQVDQHWQEASAEVAAMAESLPAAEVCTAKAAKVAEEAEASERKAAAEADTRDRALNPARATKEAPFINSLQMSSVLRDAMRRCECQIYL